MRREQTSQLSLQINIFTFRCLWNRCTLPFKCREALDDRTPAPVSRAHEIKPDQHVSIRRAELRDGQCDVVGQELCQKLDHCYQHRTEGTWIQSSTHTLSNQSVDHHGKEITAVGLKMVGILAGYRVFCAVLCEPIAAFVDHPNTICSFR